MVEKIFIPSVHGEQNISGQGNSDLERQKLFLLIKNHPEQCRSSMIRNKLLDEAAQYKATDMAAKKYVAHTSPDGVSANQNILNFGYLLPSNYSKDSNNCESLVAEASGRSEKILNAWYTSESHKVHVLGLINFYREQECVGIGYVKTDRYTYAVFLSAPCY